MPRPTGRWTRRRRRRPTYYARRSRALQRTTAPCYHPPTLTATLTRSPSPAPPQDPPGGERGGAGGGTAGNGSGGGNGGGGSAPSWPGSLFDPVVDGFPDPLWTVRSLEAADDFAHGVPMPSENNTVVHVELETDAGGNPCRVGLREVCVWCARTLVAFETTFTMLQPCGHYLCAACTIQCSLRRVLDGYLDASAGFDCPDSACKMRVSQLLVMAQQRRVSLEVAESSPAMARTRTAAAAAAAAASVGEGPEGEPVNTVFIMAPPSRLSATCTPVRAHQRAPWPVRSRHAMALYFSHRI